MDVVLPKVALTMTEAVISEWLKGVGDPVEQGEILFVMKTDKTDIDIEAPATGVLTEIRRIEGDTVDAGAVVAVIAVAGEAPAPDGPNVPPADGGVSPAAAKLAGELGVDVSAIRGTGPKGRVQESDVLDSLD